PPLQSRSLQPFRAVGDIVGANHHHRGVDDDANDQVVGSATTTFPKTRISRHRISFFLALSFFVRSSLASRTHPYLPPAAGFAITDTLCECEGKRERERVKTNR